MSVFERAFKPPPYSYTDPLKPTDVCPSNPIIRHSVGSSSTAPRQPFQLLIERPPVINVTVTPIGLLWTLVTASLAILYTYSCCSHTWIIGHPNDSLATFGIFGFCHKFISEAIISPSVQLKCLPYGGRHDIFLIPNSAWQATALLCGCSVCLLWASTLICIITIFRPSIGSAKMSWYSGYLQIVAIFLMLSGELLFPFGFSSDFGKHVCGKHAAVYHLGNCEIGWGYVAGWIGTALAVFLPYLSKFAFRVETDYTARTKLIDTEHDASNESSMV